MFKKMAVSMVVGVASGCACSLITTAAILTAPVSYPVLGGIGGYAIGRASGVAKGEIGPAVLGTACGVVSIPFAPLSLVITPITSALCAIEVGITTYIAINK